MYISPHTFPDQTLVTLATPSIVDGQSDTQAEPRAENGFVRIAHAGVGVAGRAMQRAIRWLQYHRTLRELQGLNEHMLKDIGLHHSNIMFVARRASMEESHGGTDRTNIPERTAARRQPRSKDRPVGGGSRGFPRSRFAASGWGKPRIGKSPEPKSARARSGGGYRVSKVHFDGRTR